MEYVVFVGVVALLVLAEHVVARVSRWRRRLLTGEGRRQVPTAEPAEAPVVYPVVVLDGEAEESVLVARLLAGRLSSARYQQGMADLARRDALRHPVVVPSDRGS